MDDPPVDDVEDPAALLRAVAHRLEALAARTTPGDWLLSGLLASRPEVVAVRPDGGREHVAEARAGSGDWIAALSPVVAAPLAAALRAAAADPAAAPDLLALGRGLRDRLPDPAHRTGPRPGPRLRTR